MALASRFGAFPERMRMTPSFQHQRPGLRFGCPAIFAVLWVLLTLAGCSNGRKLPALGSEQAALLDSISLFNGQVSSDSLLGRFRQHQCSIEADSLLGQDVLHLLGWKGTDLSERVCLPWPDNEPQDLQSVEEWGGISLWIRKTGPSQSDPVLVFELEDARGMRSSTSLAQRHAPTFPIDTLWQEIRIPLSDFQRGRAQTDWSQIVGLNIRMEHFGEVLLGACNLVPHERRKKWERREAKTLLLPPSPGRYIVFEDVVDHEWGMGSFGKDRQFILKEKRGREKSHALDFEWDCTPPPLSGQEVRFPNHTVGFSWNGWKVSARPLFPERSFIVFKLRNIGVNPGPTAPLPIQVGLADADGHTSTITLSQDLIPATGFGKWMECRIPFSAFDWATEEDPDGLASIGYLFFEFSEKGHVYIDDLSVRF